MYKRQGFFLGGVLYKILGFNNAVEIMGLGLCLAFFLTLCLPKDSGKMKRKPVFKDLFSKSQGINILSSARFFLFGARDVWFVVALPVFLDISFGWDYLKIGLFLGGWIIIYGFFQVLAPLLRKVWRKKTSPTKTTVQFWGLILTVIPLFIALALNGDKSLGPVIVIGLIIFGFIFAMNSSTHSYLILAYSDNEKVSLNVGYYYMANAAGRLLGTLLSGLLFMLGRNATLGLQYCLYASTALIFIAWLTSSKLPSYSSNSID